MTGQYSPGRSEKTDRARRRREFLRYGAPLVSLTALIWAGQALAQTTISTDTTTPLQTSKSGDVTVQTGGSIKPAAGTAITVDSNNNVTNGGTISFHNVDGSTGVLVQGGVTTTITNNASIVSDEDSASTTDSNGIIHGPFAKGTGRFGIRVTGPTISGSITNAAAGVVSVVGNNSTAISIETGLNGKFSSLGAVTAQGDNTYAIHVTGPVTGDVSLAGTITATGQNAQGVSVSDVGGALNINGVVTATGYRYTTRSTSPDFLKLLQPDDLQQGLAAVTVAGSVGKGIVLDSVSTTDSSGVVSTTAATVSSFGSAPALVVGAVGKNITIGNVGAGVDAFGIEIKGTAQGNGVYDNVTSAGVQIGVAGGGTVDTGGGIRISGSVSSTSYSADNTALHLMSGVSAPVIKVEGAVAAALSQDAAGANARAIVIDQGANAPVLQNSANILASVTGQLGNAAAVVDHSGTLTEIENIRTINAGRSLSDPTVAITGSAVALDLQANTTGVHIIQTDPSAGVNAPTITGDILTGSGGDRLEFLGGTVTGNMTLGAGANSLTVDGGAVVKGGLTASGGTLALTVGNGTLQVDTANTLAVTSLSLGAGSTTILTADPSTNASTQLNVSGAANIASGAKIGLRLASLLQTQATYTLIQANQLTSGSIDTSLLGQVPFLYNASLSTNQAAGTVSATLARKTAAQLNLPATTAGAYDAVIAAVNNDAGLRGAVLAQTDRAGLISLYNQLLPNHSSSIFDAASATVEAFAEPLDERQDPRGGGLWLQETNLGLFSNGHADDPGYKAWSFGMVGGYELPANTLGILGVTFGAATNTIYPDHADSAADLHANIIEGGVYWRMSRGGFTANARLAGDYVKVTSDRVISVLGGDGLAVNRTAGASWSAYGVNARVMAAYEKVFGNIYLRPLASLDYLRLMEGSYTESGGGAGMDLAVQSRTSSRLTAFAGMSLGAVYGAQRDWGPEFTLGYKGVASQTLGVTTARFVAGGGPFTLRADDVSGAGAAAHLALKGENGSGAFLVEGGAETRDGLSIYDLRLAGHIQF